MTGTAISVEVLAEHEHYDDIEEDIDEFIDYDITATPNDFNLTTLERHRSAIAYVRDAGGLRHIRAITGQVPQ